MNTGLFNSFFMGGFECSTHRLPTGKRLDLVSSTQHDTFVVSDYRLLQRHGIHSVREGLRWHLIESSPGEYDFSGVRPMFAAARDTGMQVIWDLWHYGWPDDIDLFADDFVARFVAFSRAALEVLSEYTDEPFISPINEISFFSWAAGDAGIFNPFAKNRGGDVKTQLVRATIESIRAMREVNPRIRFFQIDPIMNVVALPERPEDKPHAEAQRQGQFEAWDMIAGRIRPELGGSEDCLDVIGVNYYIHNQWSYPGGHGFMIVPSDPRYRHVRDMLMEMHQRYGRPLFIAETGIEDETRPAWLRYISNEVAGAMVEGVPMEGICLYPILNHPGWDDDRHCHNGLFDYADSSGRREAFAPLAEELTRQCARFEAILAGEVPEEQELDTSALDWAAHIMEDRTDESRSTE
jgi:beta-glucosidase/6-phospho-beta-glucosidase/beta-galactosidase